ncbi:MAG: M36 family metallopeptidase [Anaerolineae bacterium]|nr:M36 family metallopeptidase [Anaerolineae bacterium]
MKKKVTLGFAVLCLALIVSLTSTAAARSTQMPMDNQGNPTSSVRHPGDVSFLTGPNTGNPLDIVQSYIYSHQAEMGLSAADLADVVITDQYTDADTATTHIYMRQRYDGKEVFNGNLSAHVAKDGAIINLYSDFVSDLAGAVNSRSAVLSVEQAAAAAIAAVGLSPDQPITVLKTSDSADSQTWLSDGGVSAMAIPGRLVYFQMDTELRLAWELQIETLDAQNYWVLLIDASNGRVLHQMNLVIHDHFGELDSHAMSEGPIGGVHEETSAHAAASVQRQNAAPPNSYEVFAMPSEYPDDGPRVIVSNPAHAIASPFGWHDTNGAAGAEFTITRGNNVSAYQDQDNDGTPEAGEQPDGGATLDFTGALVPLDLTQDPLNYVNAAIVNLFYWNNIVHDVFYVHGFTEPAGNFQVNNYGRGGLGNDDVRAEGQDGGGTNNANFLTPADGSRPRMQMYLWTQTTPRRDGDLENSIIVHEYGHGISNRLTGGPANVSCLGNSEQMGEGWSDWLALVLTAKSTDTGPTSRGIGTYVLGQPVTGQGIRPAPYSTDFAQNNYTYANLPGMAVPHGVGFIWGTMTWDMYWNLVDKHGFNSDFYGDWNTGGNNLAIRLILDGMKLQPCSPGFVDGRNAILQADVILTGGANQCAIWDAFAGRGLGFSASQGSSNNINDGTPAFDMPPSCDFLEATPTTQDICAGQNAVYNISVGLAFNTGVAMSATGNPAPSTVSFSPNPVNAIPGSTTLTIGNTASAAPGNYTITVTGNDGVTSGDLGVGLNVVNSTPPAPTLASPPNGALGMSTNVQLSWNAIPAAIGYTVEVATDTGFTNIVYSNDVVGTSDTVTGLSVLTQYFWRVRATNPCGAGTNSPVWVFVTAAQYCQTGAISIPSSGVATPYPSNIVVSGAGNTVMDVDVQLTGLSHTWPDDIDILLVGPQGQNLIILSDAGGSADIVNTEIIFDDSAAGTVPDNGPLVTGSYRPTNYEVGDTFPAPAPVASAATTLSTFNGTDPNGTWSLYVVDDTGGDSGSIGSGWCLQIASNPDNSPPATAAPSITTPINENGMAAVNGTIVDPDAGDTFTLTILWDDGSLPEVFNYAAAPTVFNHSHQYLDNGAYTVGLLLQDSAGNPYYESLNLVVNNVAPAVNAGPDRTVVVNTAVTFNGAFTDPGTLDTHIIEWNFGDGHTASGTLTPNHTYTAVGLYPVTLTITDNDGGTDTDELMVQVVETYNIYLPVVLKP